MKEEHTVRGVASVSGKWLLKLSARREIGLIEFQRTKGWIVLPIPVSEEEAERFADRVKDLVNNRLPA